VQQESTIDPRNPKNKKSLSNIDCRQEDPKDHVHQSTLLRRHIRKPSPQALQLRKRNPPNIHRPKTHYSRTFSHIHQEREEEKRKMEKAKTNLLFQARGIHNPICNKVVVSSEILDVAACPKYLLSIYLQRKRYTAWDSFKIFGGERGQELVQ